jgi:hypothetical protein
MGPAHPRTQGHVVAVLGAVMVVAAIVWFTSSGSDDPATAEPPRTEAPRGASAPAPAASPK